LLVGNINETVFFLSANPGPFCHGPSNVLSCNKFIIGPAS